MFNNEKIVETKICRQCQTKFDITDKDLEFYEKISPVFKIHHPNPLLIGDGIEKSFSRKDNDLGGGLKEIKYLIPTPTLCPDCRQQRRLAFRNERKLYKRTCDATGKPIISIYSPDKPYKVYNQEFWWSDKWDALKYGKEFDFSKSFFHQIKELLDSVPKQCLIGANNTNSEYTNLTANNKDCYYIFESSNNENSLFGYWLQKSNNCVDCNFIHECENCYECMNCYNCFESKFLFSCKNCRNSYFLEDCIGCNNCFCCTNLVNKEYYIFNKKFTKDEYFKEIQNLLLNNITKQRFIDFSKKQVKKNLRILNSDNCIGDQIENSKNCINCFHSHDAEDCKYGEHVWRNAKNCVDVSTAGRDASFIYESINCGIQTHNFKFCVQCWSGSNIMYSFFSDNINNCFGGVGLKNKSYCILNKQYTKEEYEKLVPKIIEHMQKTGEWGEFFPSSMSPFGYNETVANEYFQLNSDDILNCHSELVSESSKGIKSLFNDSGLNPEGQSTLLHGQIFNWSTYEQPFPKVDKIIQALKLPDDISQIPDDILNWAIECEITKKPFRIISQELEFYRKHNLPIPRRHPDQRHLDRMSLRNPRKLYDRKCDKCKKDIKTTYPPDRLEIVYCEDCYNKEIY
ncbi:MAG: hypothetical protein PHN31_02235 [Candidatus Gracilibacteria bacterium]|nr:hypothetical protein [Candidatus Gracilibacteria bacterium]